MTSSHALSKHPMHPALVHFPITLFPLSLLCIGAWHWWKPQPEFLQFAEWIFLLATISLVPVAVTGLIDVFRLNLIQNNGKKLLVFHVLLGVLLAVVAIIGSLMLLLNPIANNPDAQTVLTGFSIATTLMVFVEGFVGGLLVYVHRMGMVKSEAECCK